MSISSIAPSGSPWPSFDRLEIRPRAEASRARATAPSSDTDLRAVARQLLALRSGLAELLDAADARRRTPGALFAAGAAAVSHGPLSLKGATAATLASFEKVNAQATSFGPSAPAIQGGSTANVEIGGTYDGSLGDTTLTFHVKKPGEVDVRDALVDVFDAQGTKVDQFRVDKNKPVGYPYQLRNGLTVSFTEGTLVHDDVFTLDVFGTTGAGVDPAKPFDGTGAGAPRFDPGHAVTAGSFEINGVTIGVASDDSIQSVLERVSASSAGVTALFDPATDRVVLRQKTPGAGSTIELGADDTGLLAALKLSGAPVTPGATDERREALSKVSAFAGVTAGSLRVNGAVVDVDPLVDSLEDVLARIATRAPGVTATLDATGRVKLAPPSGTELRLEDDTSGFLDRAGLSEGTFGGEERRGRGVLRFADERGVRVGLHDLARAFSGFRSTFAGAATAAPSRDVLHAIATAARDAFADAGHQPSATGSVRTGLGLEIRSDEGRFEALDLDPDRLADAIRRRPNELAEFLLGDPSRDDRTGFLGKLDAALQGIQDRLVAKLDPILDAGLLVDLRS